MQECLHPAGVASIRAPSAGCRSMRASGRPGLGGGARCSSRGNSCGASRGNVKRPPRVPGKAASKSGSAVEVPAISLQEVLAAQVTDACKSDMLPTGASSPEDQDCTNTTYDDCAYDFNSDEDLESIGSAESDEDLSDYRDVQNALSEELTSLCDGLVLGLQPNAPRGRMRPTSKALMGSPARPSVPSLSLSGAAQDQMPPLSARSPRTSKRLIIGRISREASPEPPQRVNWSSRAPEMPSSNVTASHRPPPLGGAPPSAASCGPRRAASTEALVYESPLTNAQQAPQDQSPPQQDAGRPCETDGMRTPRAPDGTKSMRRPLSCRRLSLRQQ